MASLMKQPIQARRGWRFGRAHNTRISHAALWVAGMLVSSAAWCQVYPSAPITLVVPFAVGSGTDAVARAVGQKLGERLKQPVIIDNKPGASAQIGAQFVAKAKPDGYTLFMTTNTSHSANPSLFKSLKYDPIKDFTPIARVGELPFALVINMAMPIKSLQELIDYGKTHPSRLSYATPNSTSLVGTETFKRMAGVDMVGIPYKSSPQAMTDLLGGQVQVYLVDLGSGMSMLKSERVRPLGLTISKPSSLLPGVPPISDTVQGFELTSWNGIFGPSGMPKAVVDKLNTELQEVLADKEMQASLRGIGFEVWPSKTPDEFAKYVVDQLVHWTSLTRQAGLQAE